MSLRAHLGRAAALLALPLLACSNPPAMVPIIRSAATFNPDVPAAAMGDRVTTVVAELFATHAEIQLSPEVRYPAWTFNGRVPGPFFRARVGDTLEVHLTNKDILLPHNVDFHAVAGPGGGSLVLSAVPGQTKIARFKLQHPGLFVYHCATPPMMDHIANGMYGLILVDPFNGLPAVDREYAILQSEFYTTPVPADGGLVVFSHEQGLLEQPTFVVFNGSTTSLVAPNALKARTGQRVRIYFGNIGPNLPASFHVIGMIMESLYREGDLVSPPAKYVQTTLVPPGGAAVIEYEPQVPGTYMFVDHAMFRVEKGAAGMIEVEGPDRPELYNAVQ